MMQGVCGPHFEKHCFKSCKCLGKFDNLLTILISKTTSYSLHSSTNHSFFTPYILIGTLKMVSVTISWARKWRILE